jgi:hypothetical protein
MNCKKKHAFGFCELPFEVFTILYLPLQGMPEMEAPEPIHISTGKLYEHTVASPPPPERPKLGAKSAEVGDQSAALAGGASVEYQGDRPSHHAAKPSGKDLEKAQEKPRPESAMKSNCAPPLVKGAERVRGGLERRWGITELFLLWDCAGITLRLKTSQNCLQGEEVVSRSHLRGATFVEQHDSAAAKIAKDFFHDGRNLRRYAIKSAGRPGDQWEVSSAKSRTDKVIGHPNRCAEKGRIHSGRCPNRRGAFIYLAGRNPRG